MDANLEELAQFLVKAKQNTYACGGEGIKGLDKSKNFRFKEGEYVYSDRYFSSERFGGEEVVWLKEEPIWLMNYYGGIIKKITDSTTVFAFLRKEKLSHKFPLIDLLEVPIPTKKATLNTKTLVQGI